MDELLEGRTSFIVAHRLSTIENADTILVMKDGLLIEQGTHRSLLDNRGFYYDLYTSQYHPDAETTA
jgi:ATP-binding cassette subfamily B multidrug efflux pump